MSDDERGGSEEEFDGGSDFEREDSVGSDDGGRSDDSGRSDGDRSDDGGRSDGDRSDDGGRSDGDRSDGDRSDGDRKGDRSDDESEVEEKRKKQKKKKSRSEMKGLFDFEADESGDDLEDSENDDDPNQDQYEKDGFLKDSDSEEEEHRPRKKKRKRRRAEEEQLDDDDLDLIGFQRQERGRKRLRKDTSQVALSAQDAISQQIFGEDDGELEDLVGVGEDALLPEETGDISLGSEDTDEEDEEGGITFSQRIGGQYDVFQKIFGTMPDEDPDEEMLDYEEEQEVSQAPPKKLNEVFEPSLLAKNFMTAEDDEIKREDIPETTQARLKKRGFFSLSFFSFFSFSFSFFLFFSFFFLKFFFLQKHTHNR